MSAEVQPRRRRDKKKKKALLRDEYDEGAALYSQNVEADEDDEVEALRRESNSSDEEYDVENEKGGQSVGYKIIFFILLIVMGAVATLVLVENNNRDNPLDIVSNLEDTKNGLGELSGEEFYATESSKSAHEYEEKEREQVSSTTFMDNINDIFNSFFEVSEADNHEDHDHAEEQLERPYVEEEHDEDEHDGDEHKGDEHEDTETLSDYFVTDPDNYGEELSHLDEEQVQPTTESMADTIDQIEDSVVTPTPTSESEIPIEQEVFQEKASDSTYDPLSPIDTEQKENDPKYESEPDLDELPHQTNQEFGSDVNLAQEDEFFNRDFL